MEARWSGTPGCSQLLDGISPAFSTQSPSPTPARRNLEAPPTDRVSVHFGMYGCNHAPGTASGIPRHFSPQVEAIDPYGGDEFVRHALLGSPPRPPRRLRGRRARMRALCWRRIAAWLSRGAGSKAPLQSGPKKRRAPPGGRSHGSEPPRNRDIPAAWGGYTFGQLAALPEAGVAEGLGIEGVRVRCWRVERRAFRSPDIEPPSFAERMELEHPVDRLRAACSSSRASCMRSATNGQLRPFGAGVATRADAGVRRRAPSPHDSPARADAESDHVFEAPAA